MLVQACIRRFQARKLFHALKTDSKSVAKLQAKLQAIKTAQASGAAQLEAQVATLRAEQKDLRAQLAAKDDALAAAHTELTAHAARVAMLEADLAASQAALATATAQCAAAASDRDVAVADARATLAAQTATGAALAAEVAALTTANTELTAQVARGVPDSAEVATLRADNARVQEDLQRAEQDLGQALEDLGRARAESEARASEVVVLQREADDRTRDGPSPRDLEDKLAAANAEIASLVMRCEGLETQTANETAAPAADATTLLRKDLLIDELRKQVRSRHAPLLHTHTHRLEHTHAHTPPLPHTPRGRASVCGACAVVLNARGWWRRTGGNGVCQLAQRAGESDAGRAGDGLEAAAAHRIDGRHRRGAGGGGTARRQRAAHSPRARAARHPHARAGHAPLPAPSPHRPRPAAHAPRAAQWHGGVRAVELGAGGVGVTPQPPRIRQPRRGSSCWWRWRWWWWHRKGRTGTVGQSECCHPCTWWVWMLGRMLWCACVDLVAWVWCREALDCMLSSCVYVHCTRLLRHRESRVFTLILVMSVAKRDMPKGTLYKENQQTKSPFVHNPLAHIVEQRHHGRCCDVCFACGGCADALQTPCRVVFLGRCSGCRRFWSAEAP